MLEVGANEKLGFVMFAEAVSSLAGATAGALGSGALKAKRGLLDVGGTVGSTVGVPTVLEPWSTLLDTDDSVPAGRLKVVDDVGI